MTIQKIALGIFLTIFVITAFFTFHAIWQVWFNPEVKELPYLNALISLIIFEVAGIVLGIGKGAIKLLPEETGKVYNCKTQKVINSYMMSFIKRGSSADIFSGKLSWVSSDPEMKNFLIDRSKDNEINIFLPEMNEIAKELQRKGVNVYEYKEIHHVPNARFTLINRKRPGAGVLAISRGTLPKHRIVEHDSITSPMIIAAASDLVALVENLIKQR